MSEDYIGMDAIYQKAVKLHCRIVNTYRDFEKDPSPYELIVELATIQKKLNDLSSLVSGVIMDTTDLLQSMKVDDNYKMERLEKNLESQSDDYKGLEDEYHDAMNRLTEASLSRVQLEKERDHFQQKYAEAYTKAEELESKCSDISTQLQLSQGACESLNDRLQEKTEKLRETVREYDILKKMYEEDHPPEDQSY